MLVCTSRCATALLKPISLRTLSEEHRAEPLWLRILITISVLLAAAATLWAFARLRRFARQRIEAQTAAVPAVRLRTLEIVPAERVTLLMLRAIDALRILASLFVIFTGLLAMFGQFPQTRGYANIVLLWTWNPLRSILFGLLSYLPNVFFIAVIILFTRLVLHGMRFLFDKADEGVISLEPWVHRDVARPTYHILQAAIIVLALFFIAPLLPGTGSTAAQGISIVLGLMVSLGSTSTVGNIIAGVVLTYMRPFRIGDRVKVGDTTGDVVERTFLYTKILTIKHEEVLIPSLQAIGGAITNYSAQGRLGSLILHSTVTIGYDAPWRTVHQLLQQAASRTPDVLATPAPFILQTSLDDFFVSYQLNCFTNQANRMQQIYSNLHANIQDCFNEGGVEIMSPHFTQLREGNSTTIPDSYRPANYTPPSFRVDATPPPNLHRD